MNNIAGNVLRSSREAHSHSDEAACFGAFLLDIDPAVTYHVSDRCRVLEREGTLADNPRQYSPSACHTLRFTFLASLFLRADGPLDDIVGPVGGMN